MSFHATEKLAISASPQSQSPVLADRHQIALVVEDELRDGALVLVRKMASLSSGRQIIQSTKRSCTVSLQSSFLFFSSFWFSGVRWKC